jgi:flagellar biosynthesis/type III secretory pathway chaperone
MNNAWESIAHCLREELEEYGGLLGLFEEQQNALFRRDANGVLATVGAIESQARSATVKRQRREQLVSDLARSHSRDADTQLRSLLPYFPESVRPMMEALIDEVNRLIHRTRKHARQNADLLQRTIEMHQEALRSLRPDLFTKTYSPRGQVSVAKTSSTPRVSLEAVG